MRFSEFYQRPKKTTLALSPHRRINGAALSTPQYSAASGSGIPSNAPENDAVGRVNRLAWDFVQGFAFIAFVPLFIFIAAILAGWKS